MVRCKRCENCFNCKLEKIESNNFRRKMFFRYVLGSLFEMIISALSLGLDLLTLAFYLQRQKFYFAAIITLVVLLPTTVFTNVYLSDGVDQSDNEEDMDELIESDKKKYLMKCSRGFLHFWASCKSCFCKCKREDRIARRRRNRKFIRKSAKYIFGTLVLRAIAFSWYVKAFMFGIMGLKDPKKYSKLRPPEDHWSHELLIRLDFLAAALENAPQCVVQLYVLLTDSEEDSGWAIATLFFSFMDFLRVAHGVFWNIQRGPVAAPDEYYGGLCEKILNVFSWISLYITRCCSLALFLGTMGQSTFLIPLGSFFVHWLLFLKIFSAKVYGVAAKKAMVTALISLFFLPELDAINVHVLVQFYHAFCLLENMLFVVPWLGFDHQYCKGILRSGRPPAHIPFLTREKLYGRDDECFISQKEILFFVPTITAFGLVLRLRAAQKLAKYKSIHGETVREMTLEEEIGKIYKRKWGQMTMNDLFQAFLKMLKGEETEGRERFNSNAEFHISLPFNDANIENHEDKNNFTFGIRTFPRIKNYSDRPLFNNFATKQKENILSTEFEENLFPPLIFTPMLQPWKTKKLFEKSEFNYNIQDQKNFTMTKKLNNWI